MCENFVELNHVEALDGLVEEKYILLSDLTFLHIPDTLPESSDISIFFKVNELYSLFLKFSAMGLLQDIRNNFHS